MAKKIKHPPCCSLSCGTLCHFIQFCNYFWFSSSSSTPEAGNKMANDSGSRHHLPLFSRYLALSRYKIAAKTNSSSHFRTHIATFCAAFPIIYGTFGGTSAYHKLCRDIIKTDLLLPFSKTSPQVYELEACDCKRPWSYSVQVQQQRQFKQHFQSLSLT